jgi:hypothetical protein
MKAMIYDSAGGHITLNRNPWWGYTLTIKTETQTRYYPFQRTELEELARLIAEELKGESK